MRLILQLCVLLTVLLGVENHAWGKIAAPENIAVRGFEESGVFGDLADAPPALMSAGEAAAWGYDVASDVRDGPNLYAYVQQNPWTAWDPHGLNLVTQLLKKGVKVVEHDIDGVAKIGGKRATDYMPRGVLPGGTHTLPGDLSIKYPQGVKFDSQGFPDFSPYRQGPDQKINMTGDSKKDLALADKKAGISEAWRRERGLTWHHHQDGETMQLIPSEVNNNTPHIGGAAITRTARETAKSMGLHVAEAVAPNTTEAYLSGAGFLGCAKAVVEDIGENADPGIGLIATKENAAKVGKGVSEFLIKGSSEGIDYSHSYRPSMWEATKGVWRDICNFCSGEDLKKK